MEQARERDFLLVAAGKLADRLRRAGAADRRASRSSARGAAAAARAATSQRAEGLEASTA